MSQPAPQRRIIACPNCGGPSVYAPDNPYRPFCSRRCKDHDFGAWASERYRVDAPPSHDDDAADVDTGTH